MIYYRPQLNTARDISFPSYPHRPVVFHRPCLCCSELAGYHARRGELVELSVASKSTTFEVQLDSQTADINAENLRNYEVYHLKAIDATFISLHGRIQASQPI